MTRVDERNPRTNCADSIDAIAKALICPRRNHRISDSAVCARFGLSNLGTRRSLRVHRKQQETALEAVTTLEIRYLMVAIRRQCRGEITENTIRVVAACRDVVARLELVVQANVAVSWLRCLTEALIFAFGHQYEVSDFSQRLVDVVLDTFHLVFKQINPKSKPVTDQLIATLAGLCYSNHEKSEQYEFTRYILEKAASVESFKALYTNEMLKELFCVCLTELIGCYLLLVHTYCTRYDARRKKSVQISVLACLVIYNCRELLDHYHALDW